MATRTASVTGDWNASATWGGEDIPTSADTVYIQVDVDVTGDVAMAANYIYCTGSLDTAGFTLTVENECQFTNPAGTAGNGTFTTGDSTIIIASGITNNWGLNCKDNATIAGGGGEWFINMLNLDRGNDINCTMTSGACWINGSHSDGICLAMRGNTTFNANGGLIGICGTGNQWYYERQNDSRVFNNFMIDKVVGAGGGGVNATSGPPIAASIFAPYSAGIPAKMTVLRYFHNNGGTFDLLGQDGSAELTDVPANCMNLHVSGNMQMGGNFGGSLGDPQNWRGTCKLLTRSADVELVPKNVWSSHSGPLLTSGSNLNGGWQNTNPETGTDGQTDQYMWMYRATYPYSLAMRGDTYISGGTARIKSAAMEPWIGDGKVNFAYDNFVSGNSMYARLVPPTGNNSAQFDGVAATLINCGDIDEASTVPFSVSAWIRLSTATTNCNDMHIINKDNSWNIHIQNSGATARLKYDLQLAGGWAPTTRTAADGALSDGNWHHIAMRTNSDLSRELFIDGSLGVSSSAVVDTVDVSDYNFNIGGSQQYGGPEWDGEIADARLFDSALSNADITTLASINPATDLSTGNYGKYADPTAAEFGWWKLQRSVTGSLDSTDHAGSNDGTQVGGIRCTSGFWQCGNKNQNSAVLLNSYQSDLMGGILGNADYPETAYGAADGFCWGLDCASGSLWVFAPTKVSGNAKVGGEARIYQTQPNYGNPTAIGLDQDMWWHFWNVSVTNGDWGTTTYKLLSTNYRQCFFTRIHGDMVIGDDSQGPAVYGLYNQASMGGDFYTPTDKWAYYTCAGPYGDIIIDGALVVGASGGFDYAGTRDSTEYTTQGWNYGAATIGVNSNQNYIIPPKVTAGGIFCSGGQIRFAKRNPLMCDWSGIAVAEHGKTASNYPASGTDVGTCAWTRGRLKDCNFVTKPPNPLGSLWDNEGGSRFTKGRGSIDLPEVEVTQESMSISGRPWYKAYMQNRSIHLQYAGNTDIFLPSATDLANSSYHGDYGTMLRMTHAQVVLPAGGDLYSISGSYQQKSEQPIVNGDFICSGWSPNGSGHGMDISGNLDIISGDGYDKNNICTIATTNVGDNIILRTGGKLYTSGTTFNIGGSFINEGGTVYN